MVTKVKIRKFKSIDYLEIGCAGGFHVLIGENNIGKTTIFEAIHLWKMCYDLHQKKDKSGFYAATSVKNLPFKDMSSIRVYDDMDLFPAGCAKKDAECEVTLEINHQDIMYSLGFRIGKVSTLDNAYYQTAYIDYDQFKQFADMIAVIPGKNLANFLAISESKPIANLIAKEPFMYKAQVMEKIAKGKGNEVLRNKIILDNNKENVQAHLNNVMGEEYRITAPEREKTYISLKVNGKDIFSYGSGFLQVAEIFSSIEFIDATIHLLLIDEPDAHLHVKMQKRLIQELRSLEQCQVFVISHNERFLSEVQEDEILFISNKAKENGAVTRIPNGYKGIVMENLLGCLEKSDKLGCARKVIFVEGPGDKDFLNKMMPIYENFTSASYPMKEIIELEGIDTLNGKLITYSRALKGILPSECKWLLIRDTDCVPISKQISAFSADKKNVDTNGATFEVIFQNGYGIESTFVSEPDKLARLLCNYYEIDESKITDVETKLRDLNQVFEQEVKDLTSVTQQELQKHFDRQKKARSGKTYDKLELRDMLAEISDQNIQYIMTKPIFEDYLGRIHDYIVSENDGVAKVELNRSSIFQYYYTWISTMDDLFESHKQMLEKIYE